MSTFFHPYWFLQWLNLNTACLCGVDSSNYGGFYESSSIISCNFFFSFTSWTIFEWLMSFELIYNANFHGYMEKSPIHVLNSWNYIFGNYLIHVINFVNHVRNSLIYVKIFFIDLMLSDWWTKLLNSYC